MGLGVLRCVPMGLLIMSKPMGTCENAGGPQEHLNTWELAPSAPGSP